MNKPVIFIPQEPMRKNEEGRWVSKGLNLAASAEYGVMCVVWPPDTSVISRELLEADAIAAARKYNPENDYIVAVGSPTLIAVLGWAIGWEGKVIRMLEWDVKMKRYYPTLGEEVANG